MLECVKFQFFYQSAIFWIEIWKEKSDK